MLKLGLGEKDTKTERKLEKSETQEDQNNVGEHKTMSAFFTSSCQIDQQLPRCQVDDRVVFL